MRDNCSFRSISSFSEAAPQTVEASHRACMPAAILAAPHADPDAKRGKRNALVTAEWAARPSTAQMRVCTEARRHCIPNLRVRLIPIEPHEYPAWLAIAGRYRQDGLDEVGVMAGRRRGDDFGRHIQQGCGLRDEDGEAVTRERRGSRSTNRRSSQPKQCVQTSHTATRNLFSSWDRRVNTSSPLRGGPVQNGRCKAVIGNAERIMRAGKPFYGCVKNRLPANSPT